MRTRHGHQHSLIEQHYILGTIVTKPAGAKIFEDYAQHVFIPYVTCQLCSVLGMELIWDTYKDNYLKGTARAKGGKGVTRCVDRKAAIPGNWKNSIWVDCNKTEHPGPM